MLFCGFEVFFVALVAILAEWLFDTLACWTSVAANVLAAFALLASLFRAPARLAGAPVGRPVLTA